MRVRQAGLLGGILAVRAAEAAVVFSFTYFDSRVNPGTGFFDPILGEARKAALESVAADVGARIAQNATVQIGVAPSQLDGTGFIGTASQTFMDAATPAAGIRDGEVYRRIVLGTPDVDPGFDGGMQFDFGYTNIVLSGAPAPGQVYMPDVFRHELTHLLGYGSLFRSNGRGRNDAAPDVYTRFDSFLRTADGQPLLNTEGNLLIDPDAFVAVYAQGVHFSGPATGVANGGSPLPMYFSDAAHSRDPADVMYVSPAIGFARDEWSERDIGVLTDLGYTITPAPGPAVAMGPYTADDNGFSFQLSLRIDQRYRIQASSDLATWTDLANFVATTSTLVFRDASATNAPVRFYRTATP